MRARPGPAVPGRALPAALLVALSAVVGMFAAPGAMAVTTTSRPSVTDSPQASPLAAPAARTGLREARDASAGRRATRSAAKLPATWLTPREVGPLVGSGPVPAAAVVLLLAGWLALRGVRARAARGGPGLPGGTPGCRRDRAPPAYATA